MKKKYYFFKKVFKTNMKRKKEEGEPQSLNYDKFYGK